jgi:riboflavin kinase/FMN adenylyltransferase
MLKIKDLTGKGVDSTVTVLGFFDCIHRGHESLIKNAKEYAEKTGAAVSVFTFEILPTKHKHSSRILRSDEREELLLSLGVDKIYTADFEDVKNMDANTFVNEILIGKIGTRAAFCGENFHFGKGAKYTFSDLKEEMAKAGADAFSVAELCFENSKISSSDIKDLISNGKIKLANSLLFERFFIENDAVRGRGVGRTLGFPTVNLEIQSDKIKPRCGVYKSTVRIASSDYPAITNVGSCPTFDLRPVHLESYILEGELSQSIGRVRVYLEDFLRDEVKFENAELLKKQIKKDIETIRGEKT